MSDDKTLIEMEDREWVASLEDVPDEFIACRRPEEVRNEWHRKENQLQLGSCGGTENSSALERLHFVSTGEVVQLSKIFAYLACQKLDGLLGADRGSTIANGAKLALNTGICPESLTGYPKSYPDAAARAKILSKENYAAAAPYKAAKAVKMAGSEQSYDLIGGGGAINFCVLVYQGWIPADRIIRKYAPPKGARSGHANVNMGYLKDGLFEPWNSWNDGPYRVTPEAWEQMLRHPYTVAIGLLGNEGKPNVDWQNKSPWDRGG